MGFKTPQCALHRLCTELYSVRGTEVWRYCLVTYARTAGLLLYYVLVSLISRSRNQDNDYVTVGTLVRVHWVRGYEVQAVSCGWGSTRAASVGTRSAHEMTECYRCLVLLTAGLVRGVPYARVAATRIILCVLHRHLPKSSLIVLYFLHHQYHDVGYLQKIIPDSLTYFASSILRRI